MIQLRRDVSSVFSFHYSGPLQTSKIVHIEMIHRTDIPLVTDMLVVTNEHLM